MEQRHLTLNPPTAPPFSEGYDSREWQVRGPLEEQDEWHEGETLAQITFFETEDHERQVRRAIATV